MPLLKSSILKEDIKRGKKEQLREEQQSQKAIPWNHKYLSINNYFNVNKLNFILNYIVKRHRMNNKRRHNYMMGFPRIPWTEEPGGLRFMGSQRLGHN